MEREMARFMAAAARAEAEREARERGNGSVPPPTPPTPTPALALPRRSFAPSWFAAPPAPPEIRAADFDRVIAPPRLLAFHRPAGPPPPPAAIFYLRGYAAQFQPPRDGAPYQIYVAPGFAAAAYPAVVQPPGPAMPAGAYQPVYVWPAGAAPGRDQPVYGWPASVAMRSTQGAAAAARPATLRGGPPRPPTIPGVGEPEPVVGDNFTGSARRGSTSSAAGRGAGSGAL